MLEKLNLSQFKSKKDVREQFLLLFGEIDIDSAAEVVGWIIDNTTGEDRPDVLNLLINSPGGDLHAAWACIDAMRGSPVPVRTIALGQIASAGLLIFTAGDKGMRVISENCSIMSHQYHWGSAGKHHELIAQVKEYSLTHTRLINHFKKTCGLDEDQISQFLMPAHDVYMDAHEAKKLGLCDEVKSLK